MYKVLFKAGSHADERVYTASDFDALVSTYLEYVIKDSWGNVVYKDYVLLGTMDEYTHKGNSEFHSFEVKFNVQNIIRYNVHNGKIHLIKTNVDRTRYTINYPNEYKPVKLEDILEVIKNSKELYNKYLADLVINLGVNQKIIDDKKCSKLYDLMKDYLEDPNN